MTMFQSIIPSNKKYYKTLLVIAVMFEIMQSRDLQNKEIVLIPMYIMWIFLYLQGTK